MNGVKKGKYTCLNQLTKIYSKVLKWYLATYKNVDG